MTFLFTNIIGRLDITGKSVGERMPEENRWHSQSVPVPSNKSVHFIYRLRHAFYTYVKMIFIYT